MSCILTFSGNEIDPCDPKPDQIFIKDIAHALSLMCRAGGHFPQFYSVAQHCIACVKEARARELGKREQLSCLLHDASEAYIADITRPVKAQLPDYLVYENKLQNLIYLKYLGQIPNDNEQKIISMIDDAVLCNEFIHFTGKNIFSEKTELRHAVDYSLRPFDEVESEYLSLFESLIEKN